MKFTETIIPGGYVVDLQKIGDERGFFARAFCKKEFEENQLESDVVQANLSYNTNEGTLRGLHFQTAPVLETKFIRCIRGSILDVIVDLRADSPTFLQHLKVELNSENRKALFLPAMVAHGFQTLSDDTEVMYLVSGFYSPEHERGLRADDPVLSIDWPLPITCQSDKDANWPLITPDTRSF